MQAAPRPPAGFDADLAIGAALQALFRIPSRPLAWGRLVQSIAREVVIFNGEGGELGIRSDRSLILVICRRRTWKTRSEARPLRSSRRRWRRGRAAPRADARPRAL